MSDLSHLAARVGRAIAGESFAVSAVVEDTTGSAPTDNGLATVPGRKVTTAGLEARLRALMSSAHSGAVATVTFADTGEVVVLAAPGGAFDARATTATAPLLDGEASPSAEARALALQVELSPAPRALLITAAGDLQVRTLGSPEAFQPPFPVATGILPLRVVELGPLTTATVVGLF